MCILCKIQAQDKPKAESEVGTPKDTKAVEITNPKVVRAVLAAIGMTPIEKTGATPVNPAPVEDEQEMEAMDVRLTAEIDGQDTVVLSGVAGVNRVTEGVGRVMLTLKPHEVFGGRKVRLSFELGDLVDAAMASKTLV